MDECTNSHIDSVQSLLIARGYVWGATVQQFVNLHSWFTGAISTEWKNEMPNLACYIYTQKVEL